MNQGRLEYQLGEKEGKVDTDETYGSCSLLEESSARLETSMMLGWSYRALQGCRLAMVCDVRPVLLPDCGSEPKRPTNVGHCGSVTEESWQQKFPPRSLVRWVELVQGRENSEILLEGINNLKLGLIGLAAEQFVAQVADGLPGVRLHVVVQAGCVTIGLATEQFVAQVANGLPGVRLHVVLQVALVAVRAATYLTGVAFVNNEPCKHQATSFSQMLPKVVRPGSSVSSADAMEDGEVCRQVVFAAEHSVAQVAKCLSGVCLHVVVHVLNAAVHLVAQVADGLPGVCLHVVVEAGCVTVRAATYLAGVALWSLVHIRC
uniref:Uncharacterized protein n=1 Tax=Timema bartmani TaxID=61472 RepID=A0A7R9EP52_9NEOP|nr:unnamed protein product [Timema bartmani]